MVLLSAAHAEEMLTRLTRAETACASLDLGCTETMVSLRNHLVELSNSVFISLEDLRTIADCPDVIFALEGGRPQKIIRFSVETRRTYRLRPTATWPALEIGGILMHRIKKIDPRRDAEAKVALVAPVRGTVLDTCFGLGYTALVAARTATHVTTIEKDATVLELAHLNPYSQPVFIDPRIQLSQGDASELIREFPDSSFDIVLHDPPTLSLAGELYSDAFYEQLARVLRPGGSLLHYTGSPGSRHRSVDIPGRVAGRLRMIGFARVRKHRAMSCITGRHP